MDDPYAEAAAAAHADWVREEREEEVRRAAFVAGFQYCWHGRNGVETVEEAYERWRKGM